MLIIACIGAMVLMTVFFAGVEDHQINPNRDPDSQITDGLAQVMLERNRSGHYVVTGTINGHEADFLLDTGATDVVVPANIANDIGLHFGRKSTAMTANGAVTVYSTQIGHLTIGSIQLTDVNASINPNMQPYGILLGMSALKHIEFTQRGEILTLRQYNQ